MAETALEKVVRLAGGITRAYVRVDQGRPQQVHQYPTPRQKQVVAKPAPKPVKVPARPAVRIKKVAWSALKAGQVVQISGVRYRIAQVKVPSLTTTTGKYTGSQGTGINTAGPGPAGSPTQSPASAALGGKSIPSGAPTTTDLLTEIATAKQYYVTLPDSWVMLQVL